jgi:glycosyltransferase involved in cell wall biosynthesis
MLTVLFDNQMLIMQKYGGISRYHVEVASRLNMKKEIKILFPSILTINEYWCNSKLNSLYNKITQPLMTKRYRGKWRFVEYTHRYNYKQNLESFKKKYTVFHPTYYNPYFLELIGNRPFVLTIHDMIPELFPQFIKDDDPIIEWKKILISKAYKIIAVSNCTKDDIVNIYNIKDDKIKVIYHGAPEYSCTQIKNEIPFNNYFLYVGNRDNYKNFNWLIKALAPLFKELPDMHLICVGGDIFREKEKMLITDLNINNRVHRYTINDNEVSYFYRNAKCLIYPSLYEGFGLPILEAFVNSCPVVLSDIKIHREIAGDAGIYFNTDDSNSLVENLNDLLGDNLLRAKLINLGNKRSENFTWRKSSEMHLDIYKSV